MLQKKIAVELLETLLYAGKLRIKDATHLTLLDIVTNNHLLIHVRYAEVKKIVEELKEILLSAGNKKINNVYHQILSVNTIQPKILVNRVLEILIVELKVMIKPLGYVGVFKIHTVIQPTH